ncbi:BA14K-like protein [Rhizobium sp. RU20A]|uniref:BA14K family protein n=1 Tax=Rhizobium sp. RU20A TaxID=1907412 RepID=UPI0009560B94|nr:BA14K family protein [Rhizobium sp. RU20A]SIR09069.1 BA14K-like protein [Rhizobium sp. RU20A]
MFAATRKWVATALSVVLVASVAVPAQAMNLAVPAPVKIERNNADNLVQQVQYGRGYYMRGGRHYYNGHRGYREYRRGYRQHNGLWFPLGAFAAGAIIGGALNDGRPVYRSNRAVRVSARHVAWCENRYRSYRAYDNSYQPYNGPRQQCYSPYSR